MSPFKRQPQKMVKYTRAIRRLLPTNCLSVFDHFVGLGFKGSSVYGETFYKDNFEPVIVFAKVLYHRCLTES